MAYRAGVCAGPASQAGLQVGDGDADGVGVGVAGVGVGVGVLVGDGVGVGDGVTHAPYVQLNFWPAAIGGVWPVESHAYCLKRAVEFCTPIELTRPV